MKPETTNSIRMKIAVYPGSFNPLHIGHKAIIRYLTADMDFDNVYLIVSPKNPLKDNISAESARDRFEAACKAVSRSGLKVKADDIELGMPAPQYTIRTLDALKEREPDNDFTLVIGADNLANICRWKDYERILSEYGVVVFPRKGTDCRPVKENIEKRFRENGMVCRIAIADAPMVDISSTEIREGIGKGADMSGFLM